MAACSLIPVDLFMLNEMDIIEVNYDVKIMNFFLRGSQRMVSRGPYNGLKGPQHFISTQCGRDRTSLRTGHAPTTI